MRPENSIWLKSGKISGTVHEDILYCWKQYIWFKQDRECNHGCTGKEMSVAYCDIVFLALVIQYAVRIRHIAICALPDCNIFPHYLINGTISKKYTILDMKSVF